MTTNPIKYSRSKHEGESTEDLRRNGFGHQLATISLPLIFMLLALQGVLFDTITVWVVEKRYIIFNVLPFNLYPSDLIILPIMIIFGIVAVVGHRGVAEENDSKLSSIAIIFVLWASSILLMRQIDILWVNDTLHFADILGFFLLIPILAIINILFRFEVEPTRSRVTLLMLWWFIVFMWSIYGWQNGNPNVLGDFRELIVRSVLLFGIYYLALRVDLNWFADGVIRIGVMISTLIGIGSLLSLVGLDFFGILSLTIYGALPLLLPYSLALSLVLAKDQRNPRLWLFLAILAFGIIATLSKPAIAGLVICTILGLLIFRRLSLRDPGSTVKLIIMGGCVLVILWGLLSFTGGDAEAEQHIRSAYLKQDYEIQDISGSRLDIWKLGLAKWRERPMVGWGFGYILSGSFTNIVTGSNIHRLVVWPHNILIQFLFQTGVLGTTIILVIVIGWLGLVRRTMRRSGSLLWMERAMVILVLTIILMSLYGQFVGNAISGFLLWMALGFEAAIAVKSIRSSENGVL